MTSEIMNEWTAVRAPQVEGKNSRKRPPSGSWWVETTPEDFADEAQRQFQERLGKSMTTVGSAGIDR